MLVVYFWANWRELSPRKGRRGIMRRRSGRSGPYVLYPHPRHLQFQNPELATPVEISRVEVPSRFPSSHLFHRNGWPSKMDASSSRPYRDTPMDEKSSHQSLSTLHIPSGPSSPLHLPSPSHFNQPVPLFTHSHATSSSTSRRRLRLAHTLQPWLPLILYALTSLGFVVAIAWYKAELFESEPLFYHEPELVS